MLLEMTIQNIALIEKLRIEFSQGLNVLTGETGAGKSIVIDSVNIALGARAMGDMIRTGEEKAAVQALFDVGGDDEVISALSEIGVECEDGLLAITRELSRAGRNTTRLNGAVYQLSQVRKVTQMLIDVHGQHEHQALLHSAAHLKYLDAFGDQAHHNKIARYKESYERHERISKEIEQKSAAIEKREQLIDILSFQIREIDQVKPKPSEDEKLEKKEKLYRHAEKITEGVSLSYRLVYSGDGRTMSVQEALKRASDALVEIAEFDERFLHLSAKLEELYYAAQDAGYELQDIMDGLDYNPDEAARISDRLSELNKLKRKYGPELSDVLEFRENAKGQLDELLGGEDQLEALKREKAQLFETLKSASSEMNESRRALADKFTKRVMSELSQLGMGKTRFEVRFTKRGREGEAFSTIGELDVAFYISPNPGEPLKPLIEIASGGELSRIMLALKVVEADKGGVNAMIFDEIDTGISGRMAQIVGEKMASVAQGKQVICVTHLPQIAALSDAHFLIEKSVEMGRTGSTVQKLDRAGRIRELSRMVGGAGDESSSLSHAEHMLDAAQRLISNRNR